MATTDDDHNGVSNETEAVLRENNFKTAASSGGGGGSGWATTGTTTLTGDVTIDQDGHGLEFSGAVTFQDIGVQGDVEIDGTINGVKVYRALLTQSGTDAPVATVLENSLGGVPVWSYIATGSYRLTLANEFTTGKTMVRFGDENLGGEPPYFTFDIEDSSSSVLWVLNGYYGVGAFDGLMLNKSIEILVYP
jgi:hypothetical protein